MIEFLFGTRKISDGWAKQFLLCVRALMMTAK